MRIPVSCVGGSQRPGAEVGVRVSPPAPVGVTPQSDSESESGLGARPHLIPRELRRIDRKVAPQQSSHSVATHSSFPG